jgi:hypothetical protein
MALDQSDQVTRDEAERTAHKVAALLFPSSPLLFLLFSFSFSLGLVLLAADILSTTVLVASVLFALITSLNSYKSVLVYRSLLPFLRTHGSHHDCPTSPTDFHFFCS